MKIPYGLTTTTLTYPHLRDLQSAVLEKLLDEDARKLLDGLLSYCCQNFKFTTDNMKQELDQLIETLAGIRVGKPWQFKLPLSLEWEDPQRGASPKLIMSWGNEIRLKPADVEPDPYAELKAAAAAGKVIQFRDPISKKFRDLNALGSSISGASWTYPVAFYRIKPDPVPLGPEDVPPGSVVKPKISKDSCWHCVLAVNEKEVIFWGARQSAFMSYAELKLNWLIKRPGQDWQPCHKPAP